MRTAVERYLSKVDRSDPDGCWPWTAGTNSDGYGCFYVDGRKVTASRWGYEQFIGPIPSGMDVCHSCDNPPCQRPDHWFAGTAKANAEDRERKGRGHSGRGERHQNAKLSDADVAAMRTRYTRRRGEIKALAEEYGVDPSTVGHIVRGDRRCTTV